MRHEALGFHCALSWAAAEGWAPPLSCHTEEQGLALKHPTLHKASLQPSCEKTKTRSIYEKKKKSVFFFFFFSITRLWILSQGRQPSKELTGLDLRRLQFISQLRHRNITQKKSFRVQAMRGCELMKHLSCSKAVFQVGHWDALLLLCKPQVAQSSVVLTS